MDTNMIFQMDPYVKNEMIAICDKLGMTPAAAFNIFANAFVRAKGMPFTVETQESDESMSKEAMLVDADQFLADFETDYRRMAE